MFCIVATTHPAMHRRATRLAVALPNALPRVAARPIADRPSNAKAISGWACSLAAHVLVLLAFAWHVPVTRESPPTLAGTSSVLSVAVAAEFIEEASAQRLELVLEQRPSRELSAAVTACERRVAEPLPTASDLAGAELPENAANSRDSAAGRRVAFHPPPLAPRAPPPVARRPLVTATALAVRGATASQSPGSDATQPEPLENDLPPYPAAAIRAGWQGTVVLRLEITAAGDVAHLMIAESSRHAVLDAAAASAVKRWRFRPARRDRQGVSSSVLLPIVFELPSRSRVSGSSTRLSN